jgi:hypothetical protein
MVADDFREFGTKILNPIGIALAIGFSILVPNSLKSSATISTTPLFFLNSQ